MKKIAISFSVIAVLFTGLLWAAEPADSQIKNAMDDIARYEGQFAGQTSANPSSIKRSLKLLGLTRERLDSSPNKTDPSWIEADQRYKALVEQLNNMLSPASSGAEAAPATATATGNTAATAETTAPPGQASAEPENKQATNSTAAPQQMISQQRVRIKKLARDLESRLESINQAGVKPFQDPEYVAKLQKSQENFTTALAAYSDFPDDPDVIIATEKLDEFEGLIVFGRQQAAKDLTDLGDVQARLKAINQEIRQLKLPDTPQEPYQEGQLDQWLTDLITVRDKALALLEPLPAIKEKAYLPDDRSTPEQGGPYDLKDVDRLERSLTGTIESIDSQVHALTEHLLLVTRTVEESLSYYDAYDPTDPDQQSNHFLSEGRADEVRKTLATQQQTVSEAASYAKRLNHDTYDGRIALLEQIQATTDRYEANYVRALELVRMPEAASTDSDLLEIARETLANYDDVGEIKRLVINADKRHLSKETSDTTIDDAEVSLSGNVTLSGTTTTYFYEWDEFQVTTAEAVGDKFYLFHSTLKFFTSGSETTPLNKWIIAKRFQGNVIPEENINKD